MPVGSDGRLEEAHEDAGTGYRANLVLAHPAHGDRVEVVHRAVRVDAQLVRALVQRDLRVAWRGMACDYGYGYNYRFGYCFTFLITLVRDSSEVCENMPGARSDRSPGGGCCRSRRTR